MVSAVRSASCVGVSTTPDSEVIPPVPPRLASGPTPNASTPTMYAVTVTNSTASSTNTATATSLAASSRSRPTGRTNR